MSSSLEKILLKIFEWKLGLRLLEIEKMLSRRAHILYSIYSLPKEDELTVIIHNPDQYMIELRTIVAQGKKKIGFLVGSGAAAGLKSPNTDEALIPAMAGLTKLVLEKLPEKYTATIEQILSEADGINIEGLLSYVRSLSRVIGPAKVKGLNGEEFASLSNDICNEIGKIVNVSLPLDDTPFQHIVNWIVGLDRDHPVEIFTTNYDLLFEESFERSRAPFFDGFSGVKEPFFDSVAVANDDLPPRWSRLWKLHGSLGWKSNTSGETIRTGEASASNLIFPEHLKYDQTQKAPYVALFDRLQKFIQQDDALLIATGFSFDDAHVSAKIDEALAANPSASVFAFQFRPLEQELSASNIAEKRPNFSVYSPDKAIINGVAGNWRPGDPPSRDWHAIRSTYWAKIGDETPKFLLGDFSALARFLALSRSAQAFQPVTSDEENTEDKE